MLAGRLKHRISIDERAVVQDQTTGEEVPAWSTIGTVWGSIEPLRGKEVVAQGQHLISEMDTKIRMRWNTITALITSAHRLRHQGNLFDIVYISQPKLEQREFEIYAKSGASDG